jgi:hypothetical protein
MESVQPGDSASPIQSPKCPTCNKPMRLERIAPDVHFTNLSHCFFKCDCGRDSDQLIADKD